MPLDEGVYYPDWIFTFSLMAAGPSVNHSVRSNLHPRDDHGPQFCPVTFVFDTLSANIEGTKSFRKSEPHEELITPKFRCDFNDL